jgi:hypothetical protein
MRRLNTEHHPPRTREHRERPRSVIPTPESPHHNVDKRSTTSVAASRVCVPIKLETPKPETEPDPPAPSTPGVRRSTRSTAGQRQTERYADAFLANSVTFCKKSGHASALVYQAELQTDMRSGDVDIQDPRVYSAKKKYDPDMPILYEALHGEHANQYMEAMKQEIQSLIQQSTWTTVSRSEAKKKVIKSTWVFKLKRLPMELYPSSRQDSASEDTCKKKG